MPQNPERKKQYQREYYLKNKDHLFSYWQKWRDANPERVAEYRRKREERGYERLRELKAVPCMDCGDTFPTCCMDFDHRPGEEKHWRMSYRKVNGEKKLPASFSSLCITSRKVFEEEIKKYDVVCANCHRIRTWERRKSADHITV